MQDAQTASAGRRESVSELLELTSARFFAAFIVVLYHVSAYANGLIGAYLPVGLLGGLSVDFFFVLSGFVLTHVYAGAWAEGRYRHGDFLIRRIARIWPLHVACLLVVAAIVVVGSVVGIRPPWPPTVVSFLEHLFLLNAIGLGAEHAWNQPSWSVGAEWTAYLAFPVYLAAMSRLRSPVAKLVAAVALMLALWLVCRALLGKELFLMATDGALRIIPSFAAGVALRQLFGTGLGRSLPRAAIDAALVGAAAAVVAGAWLGVALPALWLVVAALVYLLALRAARPEPGVLRSRALVFGGEASYALYLVHAPVLMVMFGVGAKVLKLESAPALLALGAVATAASLAVAVAAHLVLERPAQKWIVRRFCRPSGAEKKRGAPGRPSMPAA